MQKKLAHDLKDKSILNEYHCKLPRQPVSTFHERLSWQPLSWTSLPYRSHLLRKESGSIYFQPSTQAYMITLIYVLMGITLIVEGILEYTEIIRNAGAPILPMSVGFLVFIFGFTNWVFINRKIIFNPKEKLCLLKYGIWKKSMSMGSIVGLQLISTNVYIDDYTCNHLELILVLNYKKRIILVAHNSKKHLQSEAQELARFLRVPLWESKNLCNQDIQDL
ncbi:MAG: hypothetical protein AB8G05_15645 [Oligoflexales bacterium]